MLSVYHHGQTCICFGVDVTNAIFTRVKYRVQANSLVPRLAILSRWSNGWIQCGWGYYNERETVRIISIARSN